MRTGAITGLSASAAFVIFLLPFPTSPRATNYGRVYDVFCKPLEWWPLGGILSEHHDPIFKLFLMVCYWAIAGMLLGAVEWAVRSIIQKEK